MYWPEGPIYMGCQMCQKYLKVAYLYILHWYINMTVIYLNFRLIIYMYGPDL